MKLLKHITILFLILVLFSCNDKVEENKTSLNETAKAVKNIKKREGSRAHLSTTAIIGETNSSIQSVVENTTNIQDDWYWKNTIKSTNNTFENWEHGKVDLVMLYRYKQNEATPRKLNVGHIDANGSITINLPETIQTETKLSNIGNLVFYDIQDIRTLSCQNPNAGYFGKTTIYVEKSNTTIGTLTLGNSVRVTYNLTNQSTLTMGDEGYILSWAYLDEAATMKGTEKTNKKVRRDGTNTIETENTVVYDLEYKHGWNIVKTEVIGKYDLEHERGLNASWFKKHDHRVVSTIPSDADYFFRKRFN